MDRNRWLVVLAVVCMMSVSLSLLKKFYGAPAREQETLSETGGPELVSGTEEPGTAEQQTIRRREAAAPVDLSPPPRFFLAVATPEEDGQEMQSLAERGKAVKPDVYVASATGKTGGLEGRK